MADKSGQRPNSRANLAPSTWRSGKMKVVVDAGATPPTDGVGGYDPSGVFFDTDAAVYQGIKQNRGSNTSADFDNVQFVLDAGGTATGQMFGTGTSMPTGAGWGEGALFVVCTSGITANSMICLNRGTSAAADFRALFGAGVTVPTDATSGWFPGAMFCDTNAAAATASWYLNVNSAPATTCDFNAMTLTVA